MRLTTKQTQALEILEDQITEELLFGGGAGGGKSSLGCFWQIKLRLKYPGTRGLIGRAVFKTLKDTTLKSFFEVAKMQGLKRGIHFDLTGAWDKESPNSIIFRNGSMIFLRDLFFYPSDPDFDELGSLEITDCFIDECGQVTQKAKDTLKTRIRFKLDQFNLIPKMLFGTNPVKTWPYLEFFKPDKEKRLPTYRRFIQSLAKDNEYVSDAYKLSLQNLPDGSQKQRLLYGNWEYDDDPSALIEYDKIIFCFEDHEIYKQGRFITADIARYGADKTVIAVWRGFEATLHSFKNLSVVQVAAKIKEFQLEHEVSINRVIVDDDGVGGGVTDILKCKGFVNNSRPLPNPLKPDRDQNGNIKPENFVNLKSQCYFRLADRINKNQLRLRVNEYEKADVIEELEWVKQDHMDSDGKKQVLSKDKIKEAIGRSPDYADVIMMREWFELKPKLQIAVA